FLVCKLKIQVGEIDRVREYLTKDPVETRVIQPAGPENHLARDTESIDVGYGSVYGYVSIHYGGDSCSTRCSSAGKFRRTSAWRALSICATIQPRPRGRRCNTRPQ